MECPKCGNIISNQECKACFFCGASLVAERENLNAKPKNRPPNNTNPKKESTNNTEAIQNSPNLINYAGFKLRASALILDSLILSALLYGLAIIMATVFPDMVSETSEAFIFSENFENGVVTIIAIVFIAGYFIIFPASAMQGTPGKIAHGIIITDEMGNRISIGRSFFRYISEFASGAVFFIGYFLALVTPRKQALHDLIAGTYVIKRTKEEKHFKVELTNRYWQWPLNLVQFYLVHFFIQMAKMLGPFLTGGQERIKNMQKTYMQRKEDTDQKWYLVDATNVPLGRLATKVAATLRGKHKKTFTPHVDGGDFVVVINAEKIMLTGDKEEKKIYYNHSNYPGGLRERKAGLMKEKYPTEMIERAIKGMLPKNRLGNKMYTKLFVYKGSEHPHQAQKPETMVIKNGGSNEKENI